MAKGVAHRKALWWECAQCIPRTEQRPARTRSEESTTAATAKQQERNVERKCSTTAECGHARRKECTRQSKETDTNPRKEIGKRLVIA